MRSYGEIKLVGDFWVITKLEPHVCIRIKQIFPKIPKTGTLPYRISRSIIVDCDLEWFMNRYPLDISEKDKKIMHEGKLAFDYQQAELEKILLPDYKPSEIIGLREGQVIRHYQQQAIDIAIRKRNLLIGDEGGLGKTYTAAGFLCAEKRALPAAVVCDAHMQKQWKEKIESFTTLKCHLIKKGSSYSLPPADVYIYRVSQVAGWVDIFKRGIFKAVIYDEPQSLRTGFSTSKGSACKVLSENTDYRIGLTATPIYNYGNEMFNIMQFIDNMVLGSESDFTREWCDDGRIKDPKALGTFLRENFAMIRRVKADVGQQLPKVQKIIENIGYDQKTVQAVEDLARTLALRATTGTFFERGSAARELDIMMRQTTGVAKAKEVAMFARMIVEAGEPVIMWGWHREVYDIWNKELKDLKPVMYTGSESAGQKEASKNAFINGESNILIMSLRSGAGVDGLQHRCSTGIFGELDWTPGVHQQCIWRIDREGQKNPVTAFFLVTDDGSDPPMMDVLGIKASEASQIVDPHLGVQVVDTDTSNLRRLVERYLDNKKGVEQLALLESA